MTAYYMGLVRSWVCHGPCGIPLGYAPGLNASLGDYETQEHASRDSEHALLRVELYPFGPKAIECYTEIGYQVVRLPEFHDNVVNICFYGTPDVILKHVEHTSLGRSSVVSKAKGHRDVAVHAKRG